MKPMFNMSLETVQLRWVEMSWVGRHVCGFTVISPLCGYLLVSLYTFKIRPEAGAVISCAMMSSYGRLIIDCVTLLSKNWERSCCRNHGKSSTVASVTPGDRLEAVQSPDAVTSHRDSSSELESRQCQCYCSELLRRVDQLSSVVAQQKDVITTWCPQLNFVLSFLDIHQGVTLEFKSSDI